MTLSRRNLLQGAVALATVTTMSRALAAPRRIFDSHLHIIDHRFPIMPNQGYMPPDFPLEAYLGQAKPLGVGAGAVVSGSFHAFDQSYLLAALRQLGPGWVGVTQVPATIADREIHDLAAAGVRAMRFNMFRGRIDSVDEVLALATRAHAVAGWHAEIYADAAALAPHADRLAKLPQIVIDHLGMTEEGLPVVLDLVAAGARIKASGFGRVKMNVPAVLERIATKAPEALVFGTDIPSTRAERPFAPSDIDLVERTLGGGLASRVFWDNAIALYRVKDAAG
jgi:predicted TIM-barrel fold metal-dependent hydrolase